MYRVAVAYPGIFFGGGGGGLHPDIFFGGGVHQDFFWGGDTRNFWGGFTPGIFWGVTPGIVSEGGFQQIQLGTEGTENGDLGAVDP
jgi:hypothetical protein